MAEALATPGAPAAGHHRRSYLVDRGFQLKYALLLAAVGALLSVVFGFWLYQAHVQATQLVPLDDELRAMVGRSDRVLLYAFGAIAGLTALAFGLVGILVTHRVAGPIYVMGHYLTVLAQGRFPRMRTLRRSDELKRFFLVFLQAVEGMKRREARHAAVLEDAVERMRAAAVRSPELAPAIEALAAAARERRIALQMDDPEPTPLHVPAPGRTTAD
jgi:hypothetical protein